MNERDLLTAYPKWSGGKYPQDQPTHIHDQFLESEGFLGYLPTHTAQEAIDAKRWLAEGISPSLVGASLVDKAPLFPEDPNDMEYS